MERPIYQAEQQGNLPIINPAWSHEQKEHLTELLQEDVADLDPEEEEERARKETEKAEKLAKVYGKTKTHISIMRGHASEDGVGSQNSAIDILVPDDEEHHGAVRDRYVLHPNGTIIKCWNVVTAFVVVYIV